MQQLKKPLKTCMLKSGQDCVLNMSEAKKYVMSIPMSHCFWLTNMPFKYGICGKVWQLSPP